MLQEITKHCSDYLYHLDYVDYKSLSITNKEIFKLLDNDVILRNILYEHCNNDVYLPPDFPISKSLNELYNEITKFTHDLYPDDIIYPRWINIDYFRNDLKRNIYIFLYSKIGDVLYNDGDGILSMNTIMDRIKIINLDKVELIFPFCAYNCMNYLGQTNIKDNKFYQHFDLKLKLSDRSLSYFRYIFEHISNKYDIYNQEVEDNLLSILFIRDYSLNRYWKFKIFINIISSVFS